MVLTPTVLPNSFGVPPDLPVPYLFQVRGLPRYGFCALEMPRTLLIPICLFAGCSFQLFCSSLDRIILKQRFASRVGGQVFNNRILTVNTGLSQLLFLLIFRYSVGEYPVIRLNT